MCQNDRKITLTHVHCAYETQLIKLNFVCLNLFKLMLINNVQPRTRALGSNRLGVHCPPPISLYGVKAALPLVGWVDGRREAWRLVKVHFTWWDLNPKVYWLWEEYFTTESPTEPSAYMYINTYMYLSHTDTHAHIHAHTCTNTHVSA